MNNTRKACGQFIKRAYLWGRLFDYKQYGTSKKKIENVV